MTSEDVDTCEPYYCDCPGPSEKPRIVNCLHMSITRELGDPSKREPGDWVCDDCDAHLHCREIMAQDPGDQGKPAASESAERPDDERHPLDEALGNIHALAINLQMKGLTAFALSLAKAHEEIQTYLLGEQRIPAELPCPISAQRVREIADGFECYATISLARDGDRSHLEELEDLRTLANWMIERKGSS